MAMPVLATKLFRPPPRPQSIARPRLVERLDEGLRADRKLTLIAAPAGFGKSSLLSEWIAGAEAKWPQSRVAWLSLEPSDNDLPRFLTYLLAALQQADHALGSTEYDPQMPIEETLIGIINGVAEGSHEIVLVLDDFQYIEEPSIREAVVFLLDHSPSGLHLVIASRSDPLLPLARLRAGGELTELRAADLRFSLDEATSFLNETMQLGLSPEDVGALEDRTEGWIAGLQLAALSMRDRPDATDFIKNFTGSHRFVIDYLAEEVLSRQTDDVREFLIRTAMLDRLSGPLCDAVIERHGSSDVLDALERDNLFVVPLDEDRQWYRYHHLFADVLRSRLLSRGSDFEARLHGRASTWYESNDLPEDAVRHALAAGDFDHAARIVEAAIPDVRKTRQDASVLHWLTLLPVEIVRRRPVLSVFTGWSKLASGDIDGVEPWLAKGETLLAETNADGSAAHDSADGVELRSLPVTIALYRAAVAQARGDLDGVKRNAQRALE
ncbi:MAG: LuxR family transcriptional regulator, partial [Glaciihabitans sp.]|nr:LuxR family transcriptional regulator [Glaciihabitans sp.]